MACEYDLPGGPDELFDWLFELQHEVSELDEDEKISQVRLALGALAAEEFRDQHYYIDSVLIFVKRPNAVVNLKKRGMIQKTLPFTGRLIGFSYLQDNDVPVDSLAVNFDEPTLVIPDLLSAEDFKDRVFQIPVLAIDTHVSLGLAA